MAIQKNVLETGRLLSADVTASSIKKQANVNVIVGKGGSAKSFIAGCMASCAYIDGKQPFDIYDCDASNPSLRVMFDLTDEFVRNGEVDRDYYFKIFDLAATAALKGRNSILDFGAGMEGGIYDFLENENFLGFAQGQFNFTIVTPMTTIDSINNVKAALECSASPRVVVVQNGYYRRELGLADKHPVWLELLRKKKPAIVKLRDLGITILEAKELRLPLHQLMKREESSAMTRYGAQHALQAFRDAFLNVEEYMPWR